MEHTHNAKMKKKTSCHLRLLDPVNIKLVNIFYQTDGNPLTLPRSQNE